MYIESVQLKNFRNYDSLELDLAQGTNIFYGNNAQGKTNILEALYLCGTTKSHKGSRDKDMIQFGKDESHIRMMVKRDELSYRIDMHLKKNKAKGVAINGLPIRKASELFGVVNLVFFSPEDLNIIKNGPGERRRFLDLELCQLDKIYLTDLASYNHIVNQRNKLLKDLSVQPSLKDTLDIWDIQMAEYGRKIIDKRSEFIKELNETVRKIHGNLTGGLEELNVIYEPDCTAEKLESTICANRERDMRMRLTSAGPHRDDLCVMANGIDIRKYGSQGSQNNDESGNFQSRDPSFTSHDFLTVRFFLFIAVNFFLTHGSTSPLISRFLLSSSITSSTSGSFSSWNFFLMFSFTTSGFCLKNLISNITVLLSYFFIFITVV